MTDSQAFLDRRCTFRVRDGLRGAEEAGSGGVTHTSCSVLASHGRWPWRPDVPTTKDGRRSQPWPITHKVCDMQGL